MVGTLTASAAYEYPYLNFLTAAGVIETMPVDNLTMSIADGQLIATNGTTTKTFALTDMVKMYFTDSSGLNSLIANTDEAVEVCTVDGVSLGRFASVKDALLSLDRGTYVIKGQSSTFKIAVQ